MKLIFVLETLLFSLAVASCPYGHDNHKWQRPRPEDSRSPCPGLNAMANHGYLPRNGKNIDLAVARAAISGAFNYEPTTIDFMFQAAIDFNLSTTGNRSTIHLADLRKHDTIEFDGSLSRSDLYFGDNLHFNPSIWATVAEHLNLYDTGPCGNETYVTTRQGRCRRAGLGHSLRTNAFRILRGTSRQKNRGTRWISST